MRSRSANNFTPEDLPQVVKICRENGVKTYLTLNIALYPEDIADMKQALQAAKAAGVKQFVFLSTMGVYGQDKKLPNGNIVDENTPLKPFPGYQMTSMSSVWRETRLIRRHSGGPESVQRTLW